MLFYVNKKKSPNKKNEGEVLDDIIFDLECDRRVVESGTDGDSDTNIKLNMGRSQTLEYDRGTRGEGEQDMLRSTQA